MRYEQKAELQDSNKARMYEEKKKQLEPITDFTDDKEKMKDFLFLSKERFLESYSYLTEQEYDLTLKKVSDE